MPKKRHAQKPVLPEAIAFFLTWTTYGTWLPGDVRGWVRRGNSFQIPNKFIQADAETMMTEEKCLLTQDQRELVEQTIADHCIHRNWLLHAASCRSNHVHVVVTADRKPEEVRNQFKAWCSRKLKESQDSRNPNEPVREKWWTEKGSHRFIADEESLEVVITYVKEAQDRKGCEDS